MPNRTASSPDDASSTRTTGGRGSGAPAPAPLDAATRLLVADHREARNLLERYRALGISGDPAERADVGEELCELLIVHAAIEEEIFYPAAAAAGVDAALLDAGEHARVRERIAEVRALDRDDAARVPTLVEIAESACRHAEAEEAELFVACRAAAMDLDALAERLNERQAELLVNGEGRVEPEEAGLLRLVRKVLG